MNYTQEKKSVNRNTKTQILYLPKTKSTAWKDWKVKGNHKQRTKGNQKNDASPNSISKEIDSMKTNQIEILELRSTIISEKFTRGIQEEIWEGTKRIGKFHDRSNEISQSDDQKEKKNE